MLIFWQFSKPLTGEYLVHSLQLQSLWILKRQAGKNAPAHSCQATEDMASANHFEISAISPFPTEKTKHWKLTSVSRGLPANKQTWKRREKVETHGARSLMLVREPWTQQDPDILRYVSERLWLYFLKMTSLWAIEPVLCRWLLTAKCFFYSRLEQWRVIIADRAKCCMLVLC